MLRGAERKTSVAHTVRALAGLGLGAYASLALRRAFANPPPGAAASHPVITATSLSNS
jgi:hypothetical protein